ncbi:SDR family NAD(P)-dependent oxidoreductase [Marinactinospora thermotolerans]|uniref:Short-chain dehydrogenase n=1 Tax=Marinactinospora thermotolerans DSM 45154 TaxID=1122192 RepID=A0A1T4K4I8_9ACTN|nr:SDR family NAD(P)-dependent oxidoreductase [Marinactinospora thermotolerans]SJZ37329.1 Short-chain dehydrogenase [Marinactinospora thermotolerans DSM 45154]
MGWKQTAFVMGATVGIGAAALRLARRPQDLRGRTALVTGGSRGLGLLLARELGAQGCRVLICARATDELDRAVADLRGRGVEAHALTCDLREKEAVARLTQEIETRFGGLDILVNNAGIIQVAPFEAMTRDDFVEAMELMFWAPLRLTRAVLPMLRRRRGHVLNITSIGGKLSIPHLMPYSCAKFAQVALSEGLDAELAVEGVHVTTVVPGLMRTGSHRRALFAGAPEREYTWFSLLAGLPVVSMDAERAARRMVQAMRIGRHHLVLTPMARAAVLLHGAWPGFTQWSLRTMNRVLPTSTDEEARSGLEAGEHAGSVVRGLTALNEEAGRRFNQFPADGAAARRG